MFLPQQRTHAKTNAEDHYPQIPLLFALLFRTFRVLKSIIQNIRSPSSNTLFYGLFMWNLLTKSFNNENVNFFIVIYFVTFYF